MTQKLFFAAVGLLAVIAIAAAMFVGKKEAPADLAIPKAVTFSGTYMCLPLLDQTSQPADECRFGFQTDDGAIYAVNFGQSADAKAQFDRNAHITATGFVIAKEALSSDEWQKFDMKGIFTITNVQKESAPAQAKLNIQEICQGALAYMTFTDGKAADAFVQSCVQGEHPEVIDRYKKDMGITSDIAI
jgi:hypothetical protein